jgi:hypothetical protein
VTLVEEIKIPDYVYDEDDADQGIFDEDAAPAPDMSPEDANFVDELVMKILLFTENFCKLKLHPYQREVAYRVIESVILAEGEEITVLQARQSGKSATLGSIITGLMILLPRLAKVFPDLLGQFADGFMVGIFAPTEGQAETVWNRVYENLTSEHGRTILADPEINDKGVKKKYEKSPTVWLPGCRSLCRMQTANAKAKIESKTYHFVLVDECQEADDDKVTKSIAPMLSTTAGTRVYTGTPARTKNIFYDACMANKRRMTQRGQKRNHFEYTYKTAIKYNPWYKKYIAKEKARIGEDSDEFQMSYNCKWMLEQGMYITEEKLNSLADTHMRLQPYWFRDPVVVGIDPARTADSTVVTVVWVDWNNPDYFGYREHRILDWLEIHNKDWETQYAMIIEFLSRYNVLRIGVDATGMGGPVAERLQVLMPNVDVVPIDSDLKNQSERWKHLKNLIERQRFIYPAHSSVRRLKKWQKFHQQMIDLETKFTGKFMTAQAPDVRNAFDDYADSAALACFMTKDEIMEHAEAVESPFVGRNR